MADTEIVLPPIAEERRRKLQTGEARTAAVGDRFRGAARYPLNQGGPRNPTTGMGGSGDHTKQTLWDPTEFDDKEPLETIYTESWAAGKFIDLPVDDMFLRYRSWQEPDEGKLKAIEEAELELEVRDKLSAAMKAGRAYGTGLLVVATGTSPLEEELVVENVREGDISNIMVVDRYDANVTQYNPDLYDTDYRQPLYYEINFSDTDHQTVHPSRVLPFHGKKPLSITGWQAGYMESWGVSELIPALQVVLQQHITALMGAHLVQESSIPIIKVQGFERVNRGVDDPDDPKVGDVLASLSDQKSNFRMMAMGMHEHLERVEVDISGIPPLMDQYFKILAASSSIPATRYLGIPPVGLNTTGEGDMQNYAIHVGAMQKRFLDIPLWWLDRLFARHLGLPRMPSYEWNSLIDISEKDQGQNFFTLVQALNSLVDRQIFQPEEVRNFLISTDERFSEFEEATIISQTELAEQKQAMQEKLLMAPAPGEGEDDNAVRKGQEEEKEQEGKEKVAAVGDADPSIAAVGDVDPNRPRELDDMELPESVESDMSDQLNNRVLLPTISRFTNIAKERIGGVFGEEMLSQLGGFRLKTTQRARMFTRYHGRYITAKLHETRLKAIGIEDYRWTDQRDNKVRPEHRANHGRIFNFHQPPPTGNPGDDHNCRCKARPIVLPSVVAKLRRRSVARRATALTASRVMAEKGFRTGARAAAVGVGLTLLVDRWQRSEMEQQWGREFDLDIGGRIENGRTDRTVTSRARDVADSIGSLLELVSRDLAILLVAASLADRSDIEVTPSMRQELRELRRQLREVDRESQLFDEELDRRFQLLLRITELEQMGVE